VFGLVALFGAGFVQNDHIYKPNGFLYLLYQTSITIARILSINPFNHPTILSPPEYAFQAVLNRRDGSRQDGKIDLTSIMCNFSAVCYTFLKNFAIFFKKPLKTPSFAV